MVVISHRVPRDDADERRHGVPASTKCDGDPCVRKRHADDRLDTREQGLRGAPVVVPVEVAHVAVEPSREPGLKAGAGVVEGLDGRETDPGEPQLERRLPNSWSRVCRRSCQKLWLAQGSILGE